MKLLGRLQNWLAGVSAPAGADTPADPRPLAEFLRVVEVADATAAAGELFLRKFKHPIPDYPRHFIMQYEPAPGTVETIGYVHYLAFENCWLCGGMCIDGMAQRRMPREHREKIRAAGSLAETMLRESFRQLGPCAAIFGYVGEASARIVDLRAGFIDTGEPLLMVVWRDAVEADRPALVRKAAALGPF